MREKFEKELLELKQDLIKMGYFASQMLSESVNALKTQDSHLADSVYGRRNELSRLDRDIEDKALKLIALHQPLAKDLHLVGSVLKISTDFYRIGRYGKDIALVAKDLASQTYFKKLVTIPHMADLVCGMIHDALVAFETEDLTKIQGFEKRDDEVDELRFSIFRECVTYMMEDNKLITQSSHFLMIARYLERCGDHACNVATKAYYIVTGKHTEIK